MPPQEPSERDERRRRAAEVRAMRERERQRLAFERVRASTQAGIVPRAPEPAQPPAPLVRTPATPPAAPPPVLAVGTVEQLLGGTPPGTVSTGPAAPNDFPPFDPTQWTASPPAVAEGVFAPPPPPAAAQQASDFEIVAAPPGGGPSGAARSALAQARQAADAAQEALLANLRRQEELARGRGAIEARGLREEAEIVDQADLNAWLSNQAQRDQMDRSEAELHSERERLAKLRELTLTGRVDPRRFWGSLDTGSRVLVGIGLALGAIGHRQGQNMALQVIDQAIDRDISAQERKLQSAREATETQETVVAHAYRIWQDTRAAGLAAREAAYERAQRMAEAAGLRSRSAGALVAAEQLSGQLEQRRLQLELQLAQAAEERARRAAAGGRRRPFMVRFANGLEVAFSRPQEARQWVDLMRQQGIDPSSSDPAQQRRIQQALQFSNARFLPDFGESLRRVNAELGRLAGRLPGVGTAHELVRALGRPGRVVSEALSGDDGRQLRRLLERAVVLRHRSDSGQAAADTEQVRELSRSWGNFGSPDQILGAYRDMVAAYRNKVRWVLGGLTQQDREVLFARTGDPLEGIPDYAGDESGRPAGFESAGAVPGFEPAGAAP